MALLGSLTAKPVLFVANVDEGDDRGPAGDRRARRARRGRGAVAVSARLEAELAELDADEAAAMRADLGLAESGLEAVVRGAFSLLDLVAFFTAGEDKPAQSWHLRRGLSVWHAAGHDPLRHPEGLRPRRGRLVGRAGRVRRLRGRARARGRCGSRAATTWSHDGDVITVKFTP